MKRRFGALLAAASARLLSARAFLWAVLAAGLAARIFALVLRPLWADEIFTLTIARKSITEILAALRVDSGPPLHYFAAHILLAPFGSLPGRQDVLVRVLSLVASLLHLPVLAAVARRLGRPSCGLAAAALFAISPLAVAYAAEGRAYAIASLFVLVAFERALALLESPRFRTAVGLTLSATTAVLCHYLAIFPVAALAILAWGPQPLRRRALVLSGVAAAALCAVWVPVAISQPRASMDWSRASDFVRVLRDFPANLAFGAPASSRAMPVLGTVGAILLAGLLVRAWTGAFAPVARVLGLALALLAAAQFAMGSILLPERTALVFLPFAALLLADAPPAVPVLAGTVSAALLALWLPRAAESSPGAILARLLEAPARAGSCVLAVGYWGPELEYRLSREGLPGRVILFPSDVVAHPGWYDERAISDARLASEAEVAVASNPRPRLFVLPPGSRASRALVSRIGPARPLLSSPLVDVLDSSSSVH